LADLTTLEISNTNVSIIMKLGSIKVYFSVRVKKTRY